MNWISDLRFALRSLARRPWTTLAAVLTLTLATASVTGIGSAIYGLIYRPLPGMTEDGLMALLARENGEDSDDSFLTWNEVESLREADIGVAALMPRNLTLTSGSGSGEPERVDGASVTPDLFDVVRARPLLGRTFVAGDAQPLGQEQVAILGHGLWVRRFGGDPDIVGKTISMNQRPLEVVGVLPPGFALPETQQLYLPFAPSADMSRTSTNFWTVARPGALPAAELAAKIAAAFAQAERSAHDRGLERGARAVPLREELVDAHARRFFVLLVIAVVAFLMVAASNVATLQLARLQAREGEFAVRRALGAGSLRVAGLQLAESLWLAVIGTTLGVALGRFMIVASFRVLDEDQPSWFSLELDLRFVAFCAGVALLTALLAGWLPAVRSAQSRFSAGLRSVRGTADRRGQRGQSFLVAAQFALALVLLAFGSWMYGAFRSAARTDIGFRPEGILSARFYLPGNAYDPIGKKVEFQRQLLDGLAALPGVDAAALTGTLPADDGGDETWAVADGQEVRRELAAPVQRTSASSDFRRVLGKSLIAGRELSAEEQAQPRARAVVINAALAERMWPGTAPNQVLGRRLILDLDPAAEPVEVVGVAPDLLYEEIGEQTERARYMVEVGYAALGWRTNAVLLRAKSGVDPATLSAPLREVLAGVERDAPLYDVRTYPDRLRQTYSDRRLMSRLFGGFGVQTLVLAAVGVYAVVSYAASRRRREVGVRLALGATPRDVARTISTSGLRALGWGSVAGLGMIVGLALVVRRVLDGVDPADPRWTVPALSILLAVGGLAAIVPALRASRIEPSIALRDE
jgi:putative ABC transport system permease protein